LGNAERKKMLWFFLVLLTVFLWSFTNVFDKILVSKFTKNPLIATVLMQLASIPILLVLFLLFGFGFPEIKWLAVLFGACLFNFSAVMLYFKGMHETEMSRVMTAINTMPLFTVVLAVFFLGEKLTAMQLIGIFLMVLGALLVTQKKGLKLTGWFFAVLLSAAFFAADNILQKIALNGMEIMELIEWRIVFMFLLSLLLVPFYFSKIKKLLKEKPKSLPVALAGESFYTAGRIAFITALSIGLVSLVTAVTSVQPFIILALALVFTKVFPKWLREEIDRRTVALKVLAVCLVVIGSVMLL